MPLYEYQCDACGHRFEKIQKFSDPLVDTCPKCGSPVHKLISSPAIQFKGSGFYITDYPKNAGGAPKSSGGAKETESSGSSESGSEKSSGSDKGGDKGSDKGQKSEKSSESKGEKSSSGDAKPAPAPAAAPAKKD